MGTSYDALVVLSFGGPEGPDDVMPFLRNVTRGRGVPDERLAEVAQHYLHFGGVSPINEINLQLIAAIKASLGAVGIELPVYFGNRNWHPLLEDTVAQLAGDGIGNALVFPTSAWGGYSGCRQYHEDIARARESYGPSAPDLTKLRQFYDHPLFIEATADAIGDARSRLPDDVRKDARLVFTAHSVPIAADRVSGPAADGGWLYSRQINAAAQRAASAARYDDFDVVWQSRSGPPQVPWLEPDILDHLDALSTDGVSAVVVCPIGFVSDHLEVIWDLDHEAATRASDLGMAFVRAATASSDSRFADMVVELVAEQLNGIPPRRVRADGGEALGATRNGEPCADQCCAASPR